MANSFRLGGSPLGLVGVDSRPTRDGMSTFNGGKSRNVNVLAYNTGNKQATNRKSAKGGTIQSTVSLFTGGSIPNFWAGIKPNHNGLSSETITRDNLHNNDVYDTSILNIIEKLSFSQKASLRPQDFAYLKDLGVYPNNRLIIARKFAQPQKDNILDKGGSAPLAVVISWRKPDEDFLKITYGEEWMDAEADFTNVLNKLGEEFGIGGSGTGLGAGLNALPLPGFTETLQREFLGSLGILESLGDKDQWGRKKGDEWFGFDPILKKRVEVSGYVLPAGDPNMIKKAKRRKLVGYGQADSGLYCQVSINVTAVYEQKFISGIDPTIAYMDIINNLVAFGTQKSSNYGLSEGFLKKLDTWTSNPSQMIEDFVKSFSDALNNIKSNIEDIFKRKEENEVANENRRNASKVNAKKKNAAEKELATNVIDSLIATVSRSITATVKKYKIEIMGIANALSGSPSTPWHVTIGNPLRPIFCSGDMFTQRVTLELGKDLAFNDLPSTIKVSFDLENARPWGLQEILAKFNNGHLRTVNTRKDFTITDSGGAEYYYNTLENPKVSGTTDEKDPKDENRGSGSSDTTPPTTNVVTQSNTRVNENAGASQNQQ
jgi:hypothetical protein